MPRGEYDHSNRPKTYATKGGKEVQPLQQPNLLETLGVTVEYLKFLDRPVMLLVIRQAGRGVQHTQALEYRMFPDCQKGYQLKQRAFEMACNWVERNQDMLAEQVRLDYVVMNQAGRVA